MRNVARSSSLGLGFIALVVLAGCSDPDTLAPPRFPSTDAEDAGTGPDGSEGFPDTGIGGDGLLVNRVAPDHGPFTGGNSAVVRGNGFMGEPNVSVGGRAVQPADIE
ncbi:MAG: hypothetical protein ACOCUS_00160, partial [Polyangiales bacterium]